MWRITIDADGVIQSTAGADNACPIEAARHDNPWVVDVDAEEMPTRTACHVLNPDEVRDGLPAVLVWYDEEARARASSRPTTPARWDPGAQDWVDARDDAYRAAEVEQERLSIISKIGAAELADLRALREAVLAAADGKAPPPEAVTKLRALDAEAARLRATIPPARERSL